MAQVRLSAILRRLAEGRDKIDVSEPTVREALLAREVSGCEKRRTRSVEPDERKLQNQLRRLAQEAPRKRGWNGAEVRRRHRRRRAVAASEVHWGLSAGRPCSCSTFGKELSSIPLR